MTAKKPTHLKVLEGNPGKRPVAANSPKPNPVAPKCPTDAPAEVKKMWRKLAPALENLNLLTEVDGEGLAIALGHAALASKALKELMDPDAKISDDDSHNQRQRKHPAAQVFRDNSEAFLKWSQEFGLSPAARNKIDLPQTDESEFERMSQPQRHVSN